VPSRQLLGRWGDATVVVFCLAAVGAVGGDLAVLLTDRSAAFEDLVGTAAVLGAFSVCFALMASCRVVGTADGHIEVVGVVLIKQVPVTAIAEVAVTSGLEIVLHDGRRVRSMSHGSSLIGDRVGLLVLLPVVVSAA
jgi:hypothetical protein